MKLKQVDFPETIEAVIKFIERGYLKDLSFMMFHETVYRRVIEEYASRKPFQKDFTMREHIEEKALRFIKKTKANKSNVLLQKFKIFDFVENDFSRLFKRKMRFFLDQLIIQEDNRLLNDMLDLHHLNSAFEFSRHTWMPQCGAGSQSNEYMIQKVIADFVIEKELLVRKTHLEENMPDEDMVDEHDITRTTLWVFGQDTDEYDD